MMRIAIVDDDKCFNEYLVDLVWQICVQKGITVSIESLCEGYSLIESHNKYDLIFLDIEMPLINGIETAKKINELKKDEEFPIFVFVTNKDNLVFTALKQFPYSFIPKSDLADGIEKCIVTVNRKIKEKSIRYPVKVGRSTLFLDPDQIIYIEKEKNYVVFNTKNNQYRERSNIDEKLNDLRSYGFIRTHIGYIVNLKYISKVESNGVILNNGSVIPVSKSYKQSVKELFFDWMVKGK